MLLKRTAQCLSVLIGLLGLFLVVAMPYQAVSYLLTESIAGNDLWTVIGGALLTTAFVLLVMLFGLQFIHQAYRMVYRYSADAIEAFSWPLAIVSFFLILYIRDWLYPKISHFWWDVWLFGSFIGAFAVQKLCYHLLCRLTLPEQDAAPGSQEST